MPKGAWGELTTIISQSVFRIGTPSKVVEWQAAVLAIGTLTLSPIQARVDCEVLHMFKITGLDALTKQLKEAERALEGLDGTLGTVNFNPHDPESIEAAIVEVEAMIDERLGAYSGNPIVGPMSEELKEKYRQGILERAAEARAEGEDDE